MGTLTPNTTLAPALVPFEALNPVSYLTEYYSRVEGENARLLAFHHHAHTLLPHQQKMLEFSGGPTLYQLVSAVCNVDEIHFTDYLASNLAQVQLWLDQDITAFSWRPFITFVLELEGQKATAEAITARESLIRHRITRLQSGNAFEKYPLGQPVLYDIVATNFVLECISPEPDDWQKALQHVTNMVRPDGYFITTVITGAQYWRAGECNFPAVSIDAQQLSEQLLRLGFETLYADEFAADITDSTSPAYEGYDGMAMLVAHRAS